MPEPSWGILLEGLASMSDHTDQVFIDERYVYVDTLGDGGMAGWC